MLATSGFEPPHGIAYTEVVTNTSIVHSIFRGSADAAFRATAVSIACLTIYDMLKAADRFMQIDGIGVVSKSGGKSGDWIAPPEKG